MATLHTRREFLQGAGLVVGFSLVDLTIAPRVLAQAAASAPGPGRLDGWLHVGADGRVEVFTGKVDIGMGVETALKQIVAEELDVTPARVTFVMGDTAQTPDQGGVGGSTSISLGARPLRNAAATARAALLGRASQRLGVPVDRLRVKDGVVSADSVAARTVAYGALVSEGDLEDPLKVTGQGFGLNVEGAGKPKDPSTYTVVGTPVPRDDIAPKVLGQYRYVTDVRVPGMLHGRVVRPPGVGARLQSVDDSAARALAGFVRTVVKSDFVGVVAEHEWTAIQAAKALKLSWTPPQAPFSGDTALFDFLKSAAPKATRTTVTQGNAAAAIAGAARVIDATYEVPFQSHATMGPGCAVADVRADGVTTVWTGAQKPHAVQHAFAELLGVPLERVRVIWMADAGSYGRAGFEDAACDALLLSQAVGRPVRVQWMRDDMTQWGPKGPPVLSMLRAGLDAKGSVVGLEYESRAFSGQEIAAVPSTKGNYLGAQLSGVAPDYGGDEFAEWSRQAPAYTFPNVQAVAHVMAGFHPVASPLRSTHLRDPEGPATSFAVESFIDELALASGVDPIEFRLAHFADPRAHAVLEAVAKKAEWQPRRSPNAQARGAVMKGRGVSLGVRNGTYVGTVADVEVNRRTCNVRVTRFVCAHECGLIINPDGLTRTIEANLMQSISRTLYEEVAFDRSHVRSVDWTTYPVARAADVPDAVDVVLLDRRDLPPGGAGEPSSRGVPAAIANAIFDATGVRLRRLPFTPARVKAALTAKRA
ncbi:MAG TPA: molybdopterin cofactor-binding domain-containing protein [Vicinamibacterales bacterium]|nr:molybdopterin cofactor-binding domain-containing protein [Vicinamibacterales bacterium]